MSSMDVTVKRRATKQFLEKVAVLIAKSIQEELQRKFHGDLEVIVRVTFEEDWPYTYNIDVEVKARRDVPGDIQNIVEDVIDSELEKIVKYMESRGFEALL